MKFDIGRAWMVANFLAAALDLLLADSDQPLARELTLIGTVFLAGILGAFVILPAVLRLRPLQA